MLVNVFGVRRKGPFCPEGGIGGTCPEGICPGGICPGELEEWVLCGRLGFGMRLRISASLQGLSLLSTSFELESKH